MASQTDCLLVWLILLTVLFLTFRASVSIITFVTFALRHLVREFISANALINSSFLSSCLAVHIYFFCYLFAFY
uniref:Secreted peptide n=1 Tax=Parascaris univalens TaxID=6257 RepID=A0A915CE02_PARUN